MRRCMNEYQPNVSILKISGLLAGLLVLAACASTKSEHSSPLRREDPLPIKLKRPSSGQVEDEVKLNLETLRRKLPPVVKARLLVT